MTEQTMAARPATLPGGQTVSPMLSYEDVAAAIPWLERAFGFREASAERYADADGRVSHAELRVGDGAVMLGWPGPDYQSPRHHRAECASAERWMSLPYVIDGVHVYVDDVDAHCERARAAGARILREPKTESYGRLYVVEDLEGHRWMFAQR
jgi:PhnB protein